MNLTVSYNDLRRRVQELESQFLSTDPELIISTDDLKRTQRDTLHYFDLNRLSTATFGGYELVRQLNFSPLQPGGADPEKKLIDRLCRNLRILSNALDQAEALIRKDEVARPGNSKRRIETEISERVQLEPSSNASISRSAKPSALQESQETAIAVKYAAIRKGLKGPAYCQFVTENHVQTSITWVNKGCPRQYVDAYKRKKFKKLIYQEKSRIAATMRKLDMTNPARFVRIFQFSQGRSTMQ